MHLAMNTLMSMPSLAQGMLPGGGSAAGGMPGPTNGPSFGEVFQSQQALNAPGSGMTQAPGIRGIMDLGGTMRDLRSRLDAMKSSPVSDPRIADVQARGMEFFQLQLEMQDFGLRAEMVSKLAEHTTSSTKTILQTQA